MLRRLIEHESYLWKPFLKKHPKSYYIQISIRLYTTVPFTNRQTVCVSLILHTHLINQERRCIYHRQVGFRDALQRWIRKVKLFWNGCFWKPLFKHLNILIFPWVQKWRYTEKAWKKLEINEEDINGFLTESAFWASPWSSKHKDKLTNINTNIIPQIPKINASQTNIASHLVTFAWITLVLPPCKRNSFKVLRENLTPNSPTLGY